MICEECAELGALCPKHDGKPEPLDEASEKNWRERYGNYPHNIIDLEGFKTSVNNEESSND